MTETGTADGGAESKPAGRVGVVGGGPSGAGVAHALAGTGAAVTVFEAAPRVGGRAATRRRNGCRYDHAANYVKGERATALVRSLGEEGLVDVGEPVWTFDGTGEIRPGHGEGGHKWTWERGVDQFVERLFGASDATVRTETRVTALEETGGEWRLTDASGATHGPFEAVVLTPPAPATAELLAATRWPAGEKRLDRARRAAESVSYRSIRTVVLNYGERLERPWYALVNVGDDGAHPVGWLSREECKPGHVPDGESLLVAQMSPAWSTRRFEASDAAASAAAAEHVAALLDEPRLATPAWTDGSRWRHALPDEGVEKAPFEPLARSGLWVAGDWVAGEGRVHAAYESGRAVGERLRSP